MLVQIELDDENIFICEDGENDLYYSIITLNKFREIYDELNISKRTIEMCEEAVYKKKNILIPFQDYYFGIISMMNQNNVLIKKDVVAFYIFKNMMIAVIIQDDDHHINDILVSISHKQREDIKTIGRLIYCFLSDLLSKDNFYLEEIQSEIEELDISEDNDTPVIFTQRMRHLTKELLVMMHDYDTLLSIVEELQINLPSEEDDLKYYDILIRKIQRLDNYVHLLRELLIQSRENYQSRLDYKMNKTMELFTVVTSIFLPLTLIVGWYGMNFKYMPELEYRYAYLMVIVVCILITLGLIFWFKKRKFF